MLGLLPALTVIMAHDLGQSGFLRRSSRTLDGALHTEDLWGVRLLKTTLPLGIGPGFQKGTSVTAGPRHPASARDGMVFPTQRWGIGPAT